MGSAATNGNGETPGVRTRTSDERGPLAGAVEHRDGVEVHRGYFDTFDGLKLYFVRWTRPEAEQSDRPVVIIMHGFGEHLERYHEVAETLVAAGYPVVGIDARGHGRSDGTRAFVDQFEDYIHDLRMLISQVERRYPGRERALFGHSHGGLIATTFVQNHGDLVSTLAMTSPLFGLAVKVPKWKDVAGRLLTRVLPKLSMPGEIAPEDVSRSPEIVEAYGRDPLVLPNVTPRWFTEMLAAVDRAFERAASVQLPVFCLQAGSDKLVDPRATERLVRRFGSRDVTFEILADHYHEVFNEPTRKKHIARLVAWLDAQYPAASGHDPGEATDDPEDAT